MLRSCLLALLFWLALGFAYYYWLDQTFEPPGSIIGGAVAGLIVLGCIGSILNARTAWRDWSLVSASRQDLALRDGRYVAVSGTIHPVNEPLIAPFSGKECVICEYDLSRHERSADPKGDNKGSDFAGFLMTPCVVRTRHGDVRLLGFPVLEGVSETFCDGFRSAHNAYEFLKTAQFENRTGLRMVTLLSVFGDVWTDEDGLVQKNIRLGNIDLETLFPLALFQRLEEEELRERQEDLEDEADDRLSQSAAGSSGSPNPSNEVKPIDDESTDDEDLDDEDLDDDLDDDVTSGGSYPEDAALPKMTEKRVDIGENVCAIGVYNELRRGLLPKARGWQANRLIIGTAEQVEQKARSELYGRLIGGLIGLVVVHAVVFGAMLIYQNSEATLRHRQKEASAAVQKGDMAKLQALVRRGMDVNIKNRQGATLLMECRDPKMAAWLIAQGANVHATDERGGTALINAVRAGDKEIVQLLINAGANLDHRETEYNQSALVAADSAGHTEIAEMLRKAGAHDEKITAASGEPLPEGGGEQLAVCKAWLAAVEAADAAACARLLSTRNDYSFDGTDWVLWKRIRPKEITSVVGFTRGDEATITIQGIRPDSRPTTWTYQLRREGGVWKIERERDEN